MILDRRFVFVIVLLLMLSCLSFQRTQLIYLAYQAGLLDTERRELLNQQHLLRTEIRQEAPLPGLYHAWKEKYGHLQYANTPDKPAAGTAARPPAKATVPAPAVARDPARPAAAAKPVARAGRPSRPAAKARPTACANKPAKPSKPGRVVRQ